MVGTLRYMSPEQAAGNRDKIDHRTDIYSLGATIYELITLRTPFVADDPNLLLREIAKREPPLPRRFNPAVPRELETIVMKSLAKRPQDRYQSARELADDLRRFLDDRPVRARRSSSLFRLWRWARRHAAPTLLTISLVLAIVSGIIVSTQFGNRWHAEQDANRYAQEVARRNSYALQLNQIRQIQQRQPERAMELLNNDEVCPPDLRDFTWGHLLGRLICCMFVASYRLSGTSYAVSGITVSSSISHR